MTVFDAVLPWVVVLGVAAAGAATGVVVLTRVTPGILTAAGRSGDTVETSAAADAEPAARAAGATGDASTNDPVRDGYTPPDHVAEAWTVDAGARWTDAERAVGGDDLSTADDEADSTVADGDTIVQPATLATARESLEAGDLERAVYRTYCGVRDELTARGTVPSHRTHREVLDACRATFDDAELRTLEPLTDLYERVSYADGSAVSEEAVASVLDRLTGHEGRAAGDG